MPNIKISVFLRSPDVAWSYKDAKARDFWEDLLVVLRKSTAPVMLEHVKKSSFQHQFLFDCESTESARSIIENAIASLLDDTAKKAVIISVTEAEESCDKEAPKKLFDDLIKKSIPLPEETVASHTEDTKDQVRNTDDSPSAKEYQPDNGDKALSDHVTRIRELKSGLLAKIRGQRHAVDELVQSIFECEMFSSANEKRKGPLATFLFTGPSGVGKTFLAEQCGQLLDRPMLIVDMSEYSDNLSNGKFNGDHGQAAVVTGFVRKNPNGIILFDEVEKAHINTIHLFLQILDGGRLMDHQIKKEVSFRDTIIIMTTNAGKALYEDSTVCDLSATPASVILDALRTDTNAQTGQPFFPECITTRMANGHVILFNHLEPYALMEIIRDELALQISLFEKTSGIKVEYDARMLSALILYSGGGVSDARTLRGLARKFLVRELQEIVLQVHGNCPDNVNRLKTVTVTVDYGGNEEIEKLFVNRKKSLAAVFSSALVGFSDNAADVNAVFEFTADTDSLKRRLRGVTDYLLIDPICGAADAERLPNDVEDIDSDGMRIFDYVREYLPELPVYVLDTDPASKRSFDTLIARGARGVLQYRAEDPTAFSNALKEVSFGALINNSVYGLGRSGKYLAFNCAQYIVDCTCALLSAEKLQLRSAPRASDSGLIAQKGENNNLKFADIIGCKTAKDALSEYAKSLDNPRETALSGKKMPKGVLLYGPPGTGKTMLAKAMANECKATFIPVSATSFFGSLVGETEKNIREIFKKARRYAPSVIFVDEVDAIGRRRTGSSSTAHNEDALNTFLAEMDGFTSNDKRPVFILAATNYGLDGDGERVLDPAFVRRFDRKLLIPLPNTDDRYAFLVNCLKKHGIHFGDDHEEILRIMAERTGGMSNADLDMMHAQFVRSLGDNEPDRTKYLNTLDEFRFGEVNKMDPDHLRQTACHEAGHALICKLCGTTPSFLTIVSRGNYGGYMESAGDNGSGTYTFDQLMDIVCRCLAGRAAEMEFYGGSKGLNTGASSDINKARYFVRAALKEYAMGKNIFENDENDAEAEKLIQAQYARTKELIHSHRNVLEALTDLLAKEKSLDRGQLEDFFRKYNL